MVHLFSTRKYILSVQSFNILPESLQHSRRQLSSPVPCARSYRARQGPGIYRNLSDRHVQANASTVELKITTYLSNKNNLPERTNIYAHHAVQLLIFWLLQKLALMTCIFKLACTRPLLTCFRFIQGSFAIRNNLISCNNLIPIFRFCTRKKWQSFFQRQLDFFKTGCMFPWAERYRWLLCYL